MTSLIVDVTAILQTLKKSSQKGCLILPDVITLKNNALRNLNFIVNESCPGSEEEKLVNKLKIDLGEEKEGVASRHAWQ